MDGDRDVGTDTRCGGRRVRPVPGHPSDHPHYVVPTKAQLVKHVRQPHPYGKSVEDEKVLARLKATELKALHERMHEGGE